ncbi:MAG: Nudix family hydrolase [Xanthomonadales bacterium]|nr:Nudix family hydrolase [Xanthomonadales bacterium]
MSENSSNKSIRVVAGIIRAEENKTLLCQRLPGTHLEGLWEFPGGKIEAGESPAQALSRELKEELGIDIITSIPVMTVHHQYPDKTVELLIREVYGWEGEVSPCDGQSLDWICVDKLPDIAMPEADKPVLKLLKLDALYRLSPVYKTTNEYLEFTRKALKTHSKFIQLCVGILPKNQLLQLLEGINKLKHREDAIISLSCCADEINLDMANQLDGLHLSAAQLDSLKKKPKGLKGYLFATCHNTKDISQAEKIGVDMLCLSPLYSSDSKLGLESAEEPLGEELFAKLAAKTNIPVYAMGGAAPKDQTKIRQLGASGIAGVNVFQV